MPALANAGAPTARAFDPDKMVASIWTTKVVPTFQKKAGPFLEVRDARRQVARRGGREIRLSREVGADALDIMVQLEGVIVAADTESRAATISVDVTGQGKPDAIVQIGPAMRGTAIRDALDFVSFNDFTNQIDFARFGKAFNTYVNRTTLEKLPRDALVGPEGNGHRRLPVRLRRRNAACDAGRNQHRGEAMSDARASVAGGSTPSSCASKASRRSIPARSP